jgi:nitroreductase
VEFFDVVSTLRAMRRLKPDPVPDDLIWKILHTATLAPSGGNTQSWSFVVVKDAETKRRIGEWYLDGWEQSYGPRRDGMRADPAMSKTFSSANHLANNIASVPVLIFAAMPTADLKAGGYIAGASIYPAVQNLMLAARALGLGTTLTTLHKYHETEVRELLGMPDDVRTVAMIPVGWPKGTFATPQRRPVEDVVHWGAWGDKRARP